jgi:hypothetical protein
MMKLSFLLLLLSCYQQLVQSQTAPTAVDKSCDEVTLKWACKRRAPVCAWRGGDGPNAYCADAGSGAETPPPTDYKDCTDVHVEWACRERRQQGCRWRGNACVQSDTQPPTDTQPPSPTKPPVPKTPRPSVPPTFPSVTCSKVHNEVACNLLLGRCAWDTTTLTCKVLPKTKSPTMQPTTAHPSKNPTRSPPKCADFIGKKNCCGKKFASGQGTCSNTKVKGGCMWNDKSSICFGKNDTPTTSKPTVKGTPLPTARPGTPTIKTPSAKPNGSKNTKSPTPQEYEEYETAAPTKKSSPTVPTKKAG